MGKSTRLALVLIWMFSLILFSCSSSSSSLSPSSGINIWTFASGSSTKNTSGSYGTKPGTTGTPGSRYDSVSWIDGSGNLWLFGGQGYDSTPTPGFSGYLNDLWEFNVSGSTWTWVSGSSSANQPPIGNVPGARSGAVSWIDGSGNLWLFGGQGYASTGTSTGYLNDLWEFDVSGSTWTLVNGSSIVNPPPSSSLPGARSGAVSWIDGSGNLWLFGGHGYDSTGTFGYLNDLWEFSSGAWTLVSASSTANQPGIYAGTSPPTTGGTPGGRYGAVSWIDGSGNLWLFGGQGYDSTPTPGFVGCLNDLWEFNVSGSTWTWVSGSSSANQPGTHGIQGVPDSGNVPGARSGAVSWIDGSGNLWLFGGYSSSGTQYSFNDLWKFQGGSWTWVSGSNTLAQYGIYGGANAVPGSRYGSVSWIGGSYLWLFGGVGYDTNNGTLPGQLNDLWYYQYQL